MKKDVMFQLAFDFYDCNSDEKISEFDIFKILQFYGATTKKNGESNAPPNLFNDYIESDVLIMLKLISC
jgi:Ca2+-binding EF-hand superfamily protein